MNADAMNRDVWPGILRAMTYGLTGYYERPLEHIDDAFSAIHRPNNSITPRDYLVAIRTALASNVDIAEELGHIQPDAVTRRYLQAVEARLRKELGKG